MQNSVYKIQIDDITVRCAEPGDALAQKEAIDSSLDHLHEFMIWSHNEPESIEKKQDRIVRWRKDFLENKDFSVVVYRGEKLIACAGLHSRLENNALEIGYWVRADEVKKAVATKVSIALTKMALEHIKVDEVEIHCDIKNIVSGKIPKKLNYIQKENYHSEDNIENARWVIDKSSLKNNEELYNTMYDKITFYDIDGIVI